MNIVIMGPKGAGKSSTGRLLAEKTGCPVIDTDTLTEDLHEQRDGHRLSCREIYAEHGEAFFRSIEREAALIAAQHDWYIVVTGGSIMLDPEARRELRRGALLVYLTGAAGTLWERAIRQGVPPWLQGPNGPIVYQEKVSVLEDVILPYADIVIDTTERTPEEVAGLAYDRLTEEIALLSRAANTYGEIIRVTTFGESHGAAMGAVMDGLRPGIEMSPEIIQAELNRRRPGQSDIVTPRNESDSVRILSGVFDGKTTGAPLAILVENKDQRSGHYDGIKDLFRPGHADFTYYRKYGIRDYRGGGRASGRETTARVACGAIAKKILEERGVRIIGHSVEIGGIAAKTCDYSVIESNPVRCADPIAAKDMEEAIVNAREASNSVGGIIQIDIHGVPPGVGDPVFAKLDAKLTSAIMTIGAVKGIEIGDGFQLARLRGSESNDWMENGAFLTNHAGGIVGGISTGAPICLRLVVKPTSSIAQPQKTIDIEGKNTVVETHGRHDPCIVPRAVPVAESMAALALLDAWEIQARLRPEWAEEWETTGR